MNLLKSLCQAFGPSGDEGGVRDVIRDAMAPFSDEIRTDTMGNLICRRKGTGKRLMLTAPMDSAGLMITHGEENGFFRAEPVGPLKAENLSGRRAVFKDGTAAVLYGSSSSELTVDAPEKKNAPVGTLLTLCDEPVITGGFAYSPFLSARAGAWALIRAAEKITCEADIFFVFAAQSLLNARGITCAASAASPDALLAVGTCLSSDTPKAKGTAVLGKGPCVCAMDKDFICSSVMKEKLLSLSRSCQISVSDSSDALIGSAEASISGAEAGAVLLPVKYRGQGTELAAIGDLNETAELVAAFAERG